MPIGLALLASDDPVTIQQFGDALQELSISPDVCREVPAAVGLLKRRKFDAVIVDLQLGEPLQQRKRQRRGHGPDYLHSYRPRRKSARSVHLAGSRGSVSRRFGHLLVENGTYRTSFCVPFEGAQVRARGLALTKAGRDASRIRCREVPDGGRLLPCRPQ
jgi:hypothetical protein